MRDCKTDFLEQASLRAVLRLSPLGRRAVKETTAIQGKHFLRCPDITDHKRDMFFSPGP